MIIYKRYFIFFLYFSVFFQTFSQYETDSSTLNSKIIENKLRSFSVKGYMQIRYNDLYNSNSAIGLTEGEGFVLKTLAISVSGKVHDRVFIFIQPDFASSVGESKHVVRLADAYSDLYFDKNAVFRLRIGQSRVPFGYEHLQSSRHRLSLDASEAFANTWTNGRDIGIQFMWTPIKRKQIFKTIASMRGTGDYGMFALGIVNGRRANVAENNKNKYLTGRFSFPFSIKKQFVETSVQTYIGKNRLSDNVLSPSVKINSQKEYEDQRIASTVSLYPNPIGLRAEYVIGNGAGFNPIIDSIEQTKLSGGYILINAKISLVEQLFFPFLQYNYYSGGRPHARDAQRYKLKEWEAGIEWQLNKHFEITFVYSDRKWDSSDYTAKNVTLSKKSLRIQMQVNL